MAQGLAHDGPKMVLSVLGGSPADWVPSRRLKDWFKMTPSGLSGVAGPDKNTKKQKRIQTFFDRAARCSGAIS